MLSTVWTRGLLSAGFTVLALPTAAFTQGSTAGNAPAIANATPPQDSAPHDDHQGLHFSHPIANYSDHAVEIFGSGQSNVSKANIRVRTRPWFDNGTFTSCNHEVRSVDGAGPVALVVASITQTWVDNESQRQTDYAFSLSGMMKCEADGVWRILVMHWVNAS